MENKFNLNVNINVSLDEGFVSALGKLADAIAKEAPRAASKKEVEQPVAPAPKAAPKPAKAVDPIDDLPAVDPVDAFVDDLPADDAPDPIEDIVLFEAVKAAQRERHVKPAVIRGIFAEMGIASSRECPQERRRELLDRVNAL